jgi:ankyrin repeat protein
MMCILRVWKTGANPNCKNNKGETPIHIAVLQRFEDTAAKLIADSKSDLKLMDDNGDTALHCAVRRNHLGLVDLLLRNRPSFYGSHVVVRRSANRLTQLE